MGSFTTEALVTRYGPNWDSPLWDVDYANLADVQNMREFVDASYSMIGEIPVELQPQRFIMIFFLGGLARLRVVLQPQRSRVLLQAEHCLWVV